MEVVFNLADRYTGNVYATESQSLKGAGKTEQSACNSAFSEINIRNGKYKVMMENGKTAIVEYFNSNCDPVISRGKSLADQHNWVASLGLLNSVPPVCRECFDEPGNNVKVSYSLGNVKPEKMFYFERASNLKSFQRSQTGQTIERIHSLQFGQNRQKFCNSDLSDGLFYRMVTETVSYTHLTLPTNREV